MPDSMDWLALDNLLYHGSNLAIVWDRKGQRYGKGAGLFVYAEGRLLASTNGTLQRLTVQLPKPPSRTGGELRSSSTKPEKVRHAIQRQ